MPLFGFGTKKKDIQISKSKKSYKITKKSISKSTPSRIDLSKYKPQENADIIHPKYWEIPNRKHFYNWIIDSFGSYELGNPKKHRKYHPRIAQHFELSNIQRLVRDYLHGESPIRGVLLYLGLGVGKTCTAITISEAIKTKKKVVIFSKANLESNWIKEIKNCGADYVKNHNWWVFKPCESDAVQELVNELDIPLTVIKRNGGVFLIDFTKNTSNFNELDNTEREKLDFQINAILDSRFEFIHVDNPVLWRKFKPESINGKIIIWDEVHNLGNTMASKSENGAKFYNMFMNAQDIKIIFLSGTPIINRIFEITKIFNILKGYQNVLEIQIKATFDISINYDKIIYNLKKNKYVDQIIPNKAKKTIHVTKNPDNFITSSDNKGLLYKPTENISVDDFKEQITNVVQSMGYKVKIEWLQPQTIFPEDEEKFEQLFYNRDLNKLKRMDLIKHRIAGLTSYYEYQDVGNYPELLPIKKIAVPMSEFQFGTYERFRHREIQEERRLQRRAKNKDDDTSKSSYRIASRLACSFVFPEEIGNPYDATTDEERIELLERVEELRTSVVERPTPVEEMKAKEIKEQLYKDFIRILEKRSTEYLDVSNGSLAKYSPKYLTMLLNINKNAPTGKILVYSFFLNLIGLRTFSLVLMQSGKWAPFRIKKVNKMWELDEREDEKDKWKFVFYSSNQTPEERDIYRKIMNSEWTTLGSDCEKLIKQIKDIHPNNNYGEIIKLIMITKTGAEGLDLKEIRYIHICEPYWQSVLIDQVIGRGVRNKSHLSLPPKDRNVEVFIYMATLIPTLIRKISYIDVRNDIYKYPNPALTDKVNKVVTSDEYLFLTAERKRVIINEFQKLMKESAFDCILNYKENKLVPANRNLICMDYSTKNRDDYLSTPTLEGEGLEVGQEKIVTSKYGSSVYKGKTIYWELTPNASGKMYIYDENLVGRVRLPKPIGEILIKDGKRMLGFYAKKNDKKGKKK